MKKITQITWILLILGVFSKADVGDISQELCIGYLERNYQIMKRVRTHIDRLDAAKESAAFALKKLKRFKLFENDVTVPEKVEKANNVIGLVFVSVSMLESDISSFFAWFNQTKIDLKRSKQPCQNYEEILEYSIDSIGKIQRRIDQQACILEKEGKVIQDWICDYIESFFEVDPHRMCSLPELSKLGYRLIRKLNYIFYGMQRMSFGKAAFKLTLDKALHRHTNVLSRRDKKDLLRMMVSENAPSTGVLEPSRGEEEDGLAPKRAKGVTISYEKALASVLNKKLGNGLANSSELLEAFLLQSSSTAAPCIEMFKQMDTDLACSTLLVFLVLHKILEDLEETPKTLEIVDRIEEGIKAEEIEESTKHALVKIISIYRNLNSKKSQDMAQKVIQQYVPSLLNQYLLLAIRSPACSP
ncbi:uncharacterized protein NEMAJ01_1396 [Nematocida major]|uniref:uncharacterized protein n=1 Tax=Nematocida major TaxID=1912982 RepID=UPI002008E183|nr:uncharacterized protein NEMAJ01_1396 [Nematocida major]KAH9386500.1 hypothetical protein NEMAJ01_1396 [Nematocida major]